MSAPPLVSPLPPIPQSFTPFAASSTPAKFRSVETKGGWNEVSKVDDGTPGAGSLRRILTDTILSENLVVLCGLGTSLCLKDGAGKRLAPTMADLWSRANQLLGGKAEELAASVHYSPLIAAGEKQWNIEELLSHCQIAQRYTPDHNVGQFISQMETDICAMCRFAGRTASFSIHEDFLRRVARRPTRKARMKLFTTNYDQSFEAAASQSRFVVIDGFSHSMPQEFDGAFFAYDIVQRDGTDAGANYIENVFHLYKLHGSVDWEKKIGAIEKNDKLSNRVMIYPRDTKFAVSYEQPHLEMMARFLDVLRSRNVGLIVLGFGFADRHIAGPIMAALKSNVSLKAVIISPDLEEKINNPAAREEHKLLKQYCEASDPRLTLVAGTFEDFVGQIPDLNAETDEQMLLKRLKTSRAL